MTAAHEPNEIDGPHEGPIKTPKQLILAVLYAFVVPIFGIVLLVMYVTTRDASVGRQRCARRPKSVAERIRPVGTVEVKDATDLASLKTGEQVYAAQCTACHATGALDAPKLGDAAAWAPRIKTGFDALLHSALAGKGQMPPQGGGDFTDFEIAPRGRLHGQPGRRQVPRAGGAGRRRLAPPAATTATRCRAGDPGRGRCRATPAAAASAPAPAAAGRRRDRCRRRVARALHPGLPASATPPASPARRSSATRPPGRRASPRASTR